jgi:hypothetical protein
MDFFVSFFGNIYLLRIFCSGVGNKFVLAFIFVFYNLIQTDEASQILRLKGGIPSADVVHHSVVDRRCGIGQKLISSVRVIAGDTVQQPQSPFLHQIIDFDTKSGILLSLCAPHFIGSSFYEAKVILYEGISRFCIAV